MVLISRDWMKEKDKKILLNVIVLVAVILGFISFFAPTISADYSDLLKELGTENPEKYIKSKHAPLLHHHITYDFSNPDDPSEYHIYTFFQFFKFETGTYREINSAHKLNPDLYYINQASNFLNVFFMLYILMLIILPILLIYFIYKGIKNIYNKTRYFLYLFILTLTTCVIFMIGMYYSINSQDINNLGYTDIITIEYGFYLSIATIVLFFLAHILQNYYLEYPKEKTISIDSDNNK